MKKETSFLIRLNQKEKQMLEIKSKAAKMNKSQFLLAALDSCVVKEVDKDLMKRKLFLLSNISNNINQIAHYANIHKKLDVDILYRLDQNLSFIKSHFLVLSLILKMKS